MKRVREIVATVTFRQSFLISSATILNGFLGLLFYLVTARFLGTSLFGVFSIAVAVMTAVSDISDLGLNTGIVRFVGKYLTNQAEANKYLKISIKIKIIISIFVLVVGFVVSDILAGSIFGKPELILPLRLAFVGVGFSLLFGFITSSLQAYQKFLEWSSVQIGTNLLRLILIIVLFSAGVISVINSLAVYILMPLLGFVFGLLLLRKSFWKVKEENKVARDLFHFNKWVAGFIFVSAISSRLDTFLSARFLSLGDIGLYSVAIQLSQVVPQLAGALGTVIAPKLAGMTSFEKMLVYFKKSETMVLGVGGLGLLAIPIGVYLIPIFYGKEYEGSVYLFVILFVAALVFLISIPIHNTIIYYYAYPKLFMWLALGHLVVISFFGWVLISNYGVIGASFTVLIGAIFNFMVPFAWLLNKILNEQKK